MPDASPNPNYHGAGLTPREQQVLRELADGHPSKGIADRLGISENTVETHRKNIYSKLGIHSATEAVRVAVKTFLL
jgi:DNA-binding NarL/FixJ family response regulator